MRCVAFLAALCAISGSLCKALKVEHKGSPLGFGMTSPTTNYTGKFLYTNFAKTGSSTIIRTIAAAVPDQGEHFTVMPEGTPLDVDTRKAYVVGSIRNPCDFYVSVWSYISKRLRKGGDTALQIGPMFGLRQNTPSDFEHLVGIGVHENFTSADDVSRFRAWVRYSAKTDDGDGLGWLSARVYEKYIRAPLPPGPPLAKQWWYSNSHVAKHLTSDDVQSAKQLMSREKLRAVSPHSCWVRMENMSSDLQTCFGEYGRMTGNDAWLKAEIPAYHENPGPHGKCSNYYDEELRKFVMEKDRLIFDDFGYDSCCPE